MRHFIHWFELPATDFDRAVRFYQTVFHVELKIEDFMDDRIAVFCLGDEHPGCIMQSSRLRPMAAAFIWMAARVESRCWPTSHLPAARSSCRA